MSLAKSSEDTSPSKEEIYQALLRSLARRKGFGIVFVQGSSAEANRVIQRVQKDLPQKQIAVLKLDEPIDNLYELIENRSDRDSLNILFVQGLEESLNPYVKPGYGGEGDYYNVDTVPSILSHLNQRRELFRDHFKNICFVFILPTFAVKYVIRRAPDFFDWSAGVFDFSSDTNSQIVQNSTRTYNNYGRDQINIEHLSEGIIFGDKISADKISEDVINTSDDNSFLVSEIQAKSLREKADQLFRQNQYDQVLDSYRKALELYSDIGNQLEQANTLKLIGDVHQFLAHSHEALNSYEEALSLYQRIAAPNGEANALKSIGDVYQFLSQYDEAQSYYQRALMLYQSIHDNLGEANTLQAIGDTFQFLGSYTDAQAYYERALLVYRSTGNLSGEANTLNAIGDVSQFLRKISEAQVHYQQALEIYLSIGDRLGEANTLNALGNILQNLEQYEQALSYYDRAISLYQSIELDKNFYSQILLNRGNALQALGQLKEAINSYNKAVLIEPNLYETWFERGSALDQLGQLKEAIDSYDKALNIKPDLCEALMYKASSYSWLKNTELALASLERAIALDPHNVREWAKTNPAFKSLRRDQRFQALIWDGTNTENRIEQNNYSHWLRGLTSRWSGRFKDPSDDA